MRLAPRFALLLALMFPAAIALSAPSPRSLNDLKKDRDSFLTGGDAEQQAAMSNLAQGGKDSVALLCEVIEKSKDRMRSSRAAHTLARLLEAPENRSEAGMDALERLAKSGDEPTLQATASALMHFKNDARARKALKQMVSRVGNPEIRAQVLSAFVFNIDKDKAESAYVEGFLNDKSEDVRVSAAGLLGLLGSQKGASLVSSALARPLSSGQPGALHWRAAIAAGQIGGSQFLPRLKAMEGDPQFRSFRSEIRDAIDSIEHENLGNQSAKDRQLASWLRDRRHGKWAANKLRTRAKSGDKSAEKILKDGASDKSNTVSEHALQALATLGITPGHAVEEHGH